MISQLVLATVLGTSATGVGTDPLESALDYAKQMEATVEATEAQEAAEEAAAIAAEAEAERSEAALAPSRSPSGDSIWYNLAQCESGGNWAYNGPSGYDGGLQFSPSTWSSMAPASYPDYAYLASPEQQISVAKATLSASSWSQQWPTCSAQLGL